MLACLSSSSVSRSMPRSWTVRSHRWFGVNDLRSFGHRSRTLQMGYDREDFAGKPVIAVVNTWSEINPCHTHLRDRAQDVKRGVLAGGRVPAGDPGDLLERAVPEADHDALPQPAGDGDRGAAAVLSVRRRGACWAGATRRRRRWSWARCPRRCRSCSCRRGRCCGRAGGGTRLGSGSDVWKYWDELRAGGITQATWEEIEERIASSPGHCMTMGTASTMTSAVEALGLTMPGAASIPAADSDHPRMAVAAGRRIVSLCLRVAALRRVLRERHQGGPRVGRLDQRRHPPDRHGGPRGHPVVAVPLRRALARGPGPGQHPAVRASTSCRTSSRREACAALMTRLDLHDVPTVSGLDHLAGA